MSITLRAKLFQASLGWNVNSNPTLCGFMKKKYLSLKKTAHINIFDHFIRLYLTKNIKKSKYLIGIFGEISVIISKVLKTKNSFKNSCNRNSCNRNSCKIQATKNQWKMEKKTRKKICLTPELFFLTPCPFKLN